MDDAVAVYKKLKGFPPPRSSAGEALVWMTSCTMISTAVYQRLGPFEDHLFIDYVDTEYALRMRAAGYKIIESGSAVLEHSLGKMTPHVFFGRHLFVTNHSPKRRYFITRNRLILLRRYFWKDKEWVKSDLIDFVKGTVALFLFERERWLKARYMALAVWDAIFGRMGSRGIL